MLNTKTYNVTINPNETTKQAVVNIEPTGTFDLTKVNEAGGKVAGVRYRFWNEDGTYNKVHTTSNAGSIKLEGLKLGKYYYQEESTVAPYLLDSKVYSFELKYKDQHTSVIYGSATRVNIEPTGTFDLIKQNEDGGKVEGARYRFWSEDGTYNKVYTTSKTGGIRLEGLKLGKYYYQEESTVAPYLLDSTIYSFEIKYKDQNTSIIYESATRVNNEPRGVFDLIKENSDNTARINGVPYRIWSEKGNYDKVHTTTGKGEIKVEGLRLRQIFLSRAAGS